MTTDECDRGFGTRRATQWTPIADGARGGHARRELRRVADALAGSIAVANQQPGKPPPRAPLMNGLAGIALADAYLAEAGLEGCHDELAWIHLTEAVSSIPELRGDGSLSRGVAGVAFALEHVTESDETDDPNAEVDAALAEEVAGRDDLPIELLLGLAGRAVYALERLPRVSARALIAAIGSRLLDAAEDREVGTAWRSRADPRYSAPDLCERYPEGWFDLGVVKGNPAVIAVLAGCPAELGTQRVARAGMEWMWSLRTEDGPAMFPFVEGQEPNPQSGWCYGDPGRAAVLFAAARALGDDTWEARWLEVLRSTLRRPPTDEMGMGLCHGAFGMVHIYNRIYQATGHSEFRDGALVWLDLGLDLLGRKTPSSGLLNGFAGIALALVAALTDVEPEWDRAMLLSLRIERAEGSPAQREQ